MTFDFETNPEPQRFCASIARKMAALFHIPLTEALGRINAHWRGMAFLGEEDMLYHRDEDLWAREIYFEQWPPWWKVPDPRPRPYP